MKQSFRLMVLSCVLWMAFPSGVKAQQQWMLNGDLDLLYRAVHVHISGEQDQSSLDLQIAPDGNSSVLGILKLDHWKVLASDVSTELNIKLVKNDTGDAVAPTWEGELNSRYSLVNYKPIDDITGQFAIKDNKLYVHRLTFNNTTISGTVDLIKPYKFNYTVNIGGIELRSFMPLFVNNADQLYPSGEVNGVVQFSGVPDTVYLKGSLGTYDGTVKSMAFQSILLNFEGVYPTVRVFDSVVTNSDGMSFILDGLIDLSERDHIARNFSSLRKSPLTKNDGLSSEWIIKRNKSPNTSSVTELKYLQRSADPSDPLLEEMDMLGVERKIRF